MSVRRGLSRPLLHDTEPLGESAARGHIAATALLPGSIGWVGLELERHVIDRRRPTQHVSWRRLEEALAGLVLPGGSALSLEPGGQVELSTRPEWGVAAAVGALRRDDAALRSAVAEAGLALLGVGADPVRAPVRVHPGSRYAAMAAYFGARGFGRDGAAMMCSTAALQVNVEAGPAAGWADRVAGIHVLGPALVALSGASPLLAGAETGWRSSRQAVWGRLDPGRCAPFPGHGDPAGAWTSFALAAPVMFVRDLRTGGCHPVGERVPLVDWVSGARRLAGRQPTAADVDLHLTTLWPPLRLRGWLELRLLDAVPDRYWPGLAAVAATVLDDPVAFDEAMAAAEPVTGRWGDAARLGVRDPALARAARGLVAAALGAVSGVLRGPVEAWAELVDAGRTPADAVLERARRDGAAACLLAEELS